MDSILKSKRLEKGMTLEEVGNLVGVGKSTVRKWENGMIENMGRDKIVALSKALNISPLEILGVDEQKLPKSDITTVYNQLVPPRQEKVYNFAERQLREQNKKVVPLVGQTAANPTELTYVDETYDETVETNVPKSADYALVVKGDSMEPIFADGSIVFYKQQDDVENGEIAVVEIDGNGVTLILRSLNDKYEDRVLHPDEVRIIGKVVK